MDEKYVILNTMLHIATDELDGEFKDLTSVDYTNQRTLINSLFCNGGYNQGLVILRLTVIDSLYSTNAAYSYFSFEEMAERIMALGSRSEACDYFYNIARQGGDNLKLFDEPYGIQKDLSEGSKQMSLLSKYAYYEIMQDKSRYPLGFPIYDRLAKNAYPIVCRLLGLKPIARMSEQSSPSIETYVRCLDQLRQAIFGDNETLFEGKYQQFDILDAYLWRMGKFDGGNLSLLMKRGDYTTFIKNIGLDVNTGKLSSNDFNDAVRKALLHSNKPFKGCTNEDYLESLRQHWQFFALHQRQGNPQEIKSVNNIINKPQTTTIMEIKIDGRLLVSTLCERFKKEFGGTLRVYNGNKCCTGAEKVADLVKTTGSYECRSSKTVAGFIKDVQEQFGLKVKIASADDWVLALPEMTLSKLTDIPKNATKKDMEALKSKYAK